MKSNAFLIRAMAVTTFVAVVASAQAFSMEDAEDRAFNRYCLAIMTSGKHSPNEPGPAQHRFMGSRFWATHSTRRRIGAYRRKRRRTE